MNICVALCVNFEDLWTQCVTRDSTLPESHNEEGGVLFLISVESK